MNKSEFWIRLLLYILISGLMPAAFLIWRFHLFTTVSKLSIGGWGMVCIIFVAVFFIKLIKAVRKGLPFSYFTQILSIICKEIIPLVTAILVIYCLQDYITEVMQFLIVVTICRLLGGLIDPLPQWAHDNKIEMEKSKIMTIFQAVNKEK